MSSTLPLFPLTNPSLLDQGPIFVSPYKANLIPYTSPSLFLPQVPQPSQEMLEREKTLAYLRGNNKELREILAQIKLPKMDVLTLVSHTRLEFTDLIHELVITLLPHEVKKIKLIITLPSLILDYSTPLSKKRKAKELKELPSPNGK